MNKDEARAELKTLIEEVLPEIDEVDFSKKIVSEYGVNSVSIIRLIVSIENKFDVSFTDYELDLDGYDTFEDLLHITAKKIEQNEE